jgi:DNA-binding MarR family transcriptional regulator
MAEDVIDAIVGQWRQEFPDLDLSSTQVLQRIIRLALLLSASFTEVFDRHGLSFGDWQLLAILRRAGSPHQMNPTALYGQLVLSSGAVSNRLFRLEAAGLVQRLADPSDRRGTLVRLTQRGMRVCDQAHRDLLAHQEQLLGGISASERNQLSRLLRKLLVSPPVRSLDPAHAAGGPRRPATSGTGSPQAARVRGAAQLRRRR